jgi:hypothetical protein
LHFFARAAARRRAASLFAREQIAESRSRQHGFSKIAEIFEFLIARRAWPDIVSGRNVFPGD